MNSFLSPEILPIAIVVFAVILILMGVKRVPQGLEYTVERFGRYTKTLKPGIQFIIPFVDKIGQRVNMMEQVADVPQQEVITKDNAMVSADGVVFFKVMDAAKSAEGKLFTSCRRLRSPLDLAFSAS